MKTTIKINGLDVEFTDQRPTRPGAYWFAFRVPDGDLTAPMLVEFPKWKRDGYWSAPLGPLTEVEAVERLIEEAHRALGSAIDLAEDIAAGRVDDTPLLEVLFVLGRHIESRPRRVVEGLE